MTEQKSYNLRRASAVAQALNKPDDNDNHNGEVTGDSDNEFVVSDNEENE